MNAGTAGNLGSTGIVLGSSGKVEGAGNVASNGGGLSNTTTEMRYR